MPNDADLVIPAALFLALDPPPRYAVAVLEHQASRIAQWLAPALPFLGFPCLVLLAALPAWLGAPIGRPLVSTATWPPTPRELAIALAWSAWLVGFLWSWSTGRLAAGARTLWALCRDDCPWDERLAIATGLRGHVAIPPGPISEWTTTAMHALGCPLVQDGTILRPDDHLLITRLEADLRSAPPPVTALDHGYVELKIAIVFSLNGFRLPGRRVALSTARALGYGLVFGCPSRGLARTLDTTALAFADRRLIQRDVVRLAFLAGPGMAAPPLDLAAALRAHQRLLSHHLMSLADERHAKTMSAPPSLTHLPPGSGGAV